MTQKERMLNELPYKAWEGTLPAERLRARKLVHQYNTCNPSSRRKLERLLRQLLGRAGQTINIEPPFRCDYGSNIFVGENFFANFNCTILDVGKVEIGNNVMFGPNVSLYTAGHPVHHESRNSGYEFGIGITIGDNVWIGGGAIVNPGVSIGRNSVIGSGSVVTKDIPDNVIACGNPCRVIRVITAEDVNSYFQKRVFDVDDHIVRET